MTGLPDAAAQWDAEAPTFDEAPDHGLRDPAVRAAWRDLLLAVLPAPPADVADLGCGTGTLALLLHEQGYRVGGLDVSPAMVALARRKLEGTGVEVRLGDAADPGLAPASLDVVLCRHVLWALPDQEAVVHRWLAALRPGGRLVLVEGDWSTGAGLTAERCAQVVGTRAVRSRCAASRTRPCGVGRSPTSGTSSSPGRDVVRVLLRAPARRSR